jgi:hypothetical protein
MVDDVLLFRRGADYIYISAVADCVVKRAESGVDGVADQWQFLRVAPIRFTEKVTLAEGIRVRAPEDSVSNVVWT